MKKIFFLTGLLIITFPLMAIDITADLFTYDNEKIEHEFANLKTIESFLILNPDASNDEILSAFPLAGELLNTKVNIAANYLDITAPGKLPSFWFAFTLSAIGTYFIYGAVAGPISVLIVYASTNKDKPETKKAIWGCLTGTIIGAGIKYAVVSFM
jgi:hypothetical protein